MIYRTVCVLLLSLSAGLSLPAQDKSAAGSAKTPEPAKSPGTLPADVQNFSGQVTGTVASVDLAKTELKVKVTTVQADAARSKATKPEALIGLTIKVTPLLKKGADGKEALDEVSVKYIKTAKAGDSVSIPVRASSKGVDFRLLKVPSAGRP